MSEPVGKPPGFKTWPRMYLFVLGVMLLQVALYLWIATSYQ
jgi:hypothetical protein